MRAFVVGIVDDNWQLASSFASGKLVLAAKTGTPPPDAVGTFALDFQ